MVPEAGWPLHVVDVLPFRRRLTPGLARVPVALLRATRDCARLIRARRAADRPVVAVTLGGYVSLPLALAARWTGTPYVVHEQNAVPGLANRIARAGRRPSRCRSPPASTGSHRARGRGSSSPATPSGRRSRRWRACPPPSAPPAAPRRSPASGWSPGGAPCSSSAAAWARAASTRRSRTRSGASPTRAASRCSTPPAAAVTPRPCAPGMRPVRPPAPRTPPGPSRSCGAWSSSTGWTSRTRSPTWPCAARARRPSRSSPSSGCRPSSSRTHTAPRTSRPRTRGTSRPPAAPSSSADADLDGAAGSSRRCSLPSCRSSACGACRRSGPSARTSGRGARTRSGGSSSPCWWRPSAGSRTCRRGRSSARRRSSAAPPPCSRSSP